jgi:hypothetical protein
MWHVLVEQNCIQGVQGGNIKNTDHLEDLGIYGKITLKLILKKQDQRVWMGSITLMTGTSGRLLRTQYTEPWGSIKGGEFLE